MMADTRSPQTLCRTSMKVRLAGLGAACGCVCACVRVREGGAGEWKGGRVCARTREGVCVARRPTPADLLVVQ